MQDIHARREVKDILDKIAAYSPEDAIVLGKDLQRAMSDSQIEEVREMAEEWLDEHEAGTV